jgi:predicted acetyltransferase
MPELVRPAPRYEASYSEAAAESFEASHGRAPTDSELVMQVRATRAFDDNFAELALPDQVPSSTFWLVDGDQYLGRVDIRHRLNKSLTWYGGHIGFEIRLSARRKGYGRLALQLGLAECRRLGLHRVLVTCDATNVASRRIIEANGGILEDVIDLDAQGTQGMRFWIDV